MKFRNNYNEIADLCHTKEMKKLYLFFILLVSTFSGFSQDCVKIESILVDACTIGNSCGSSAAPSCNCEGKNEMLRFKVGNTAKSVDDLIINWPNNSFQGICQNAASADNTAELNSTIESCGWLVEPVNGLLPANSQVLVITSTDMCTASNSFANLSDTLIIIFQCPGNFTGHFANYGTGFRTTTISFGGGCTSTASYNRALLESEFGTNMAADGATVDFPSVGSPIYYNNGCNAPVPAEVVDAGEDIESCPDDPFELDGYLEGDFTEWYWSGGSGTFDDPNTLDPVYTPGPADGNGFTLTLNAVNCNGLVTDEVFVSFLTEEVPVISPDGPLEICPGETIELIATGSGQITWNTGDVGSVLMVSEAGIYSATLEGACSSTEATVEVIASTNSTLSVLPSGEALICDGESVQLSAVGTGDFLWSTGSTDSEIEVNLPGVYTVTLTNSCGTFEESISVSVLNPPVLTLNSPSEILLCEGNSVVLEAEGTGNFNWSNGAETASITVSDLGSYTVTLSNACGSDNETIEVLDGGSLPNANINISGNTAICLGESVILTAETADDFVWSNGSNAEEIEVFFPGTYTLLATNQCGTTESEIEITQLSVPLVTLSPDQASICHGEPVQLNALSSLPVVWSTGSTANLLEVHSPGVYYVSVANECGSDTAFAEILSGNPLAEFTISSDTGSAPLDVFFTNQSDNADWYNWFINDELAGDHEHLNYTFHKPGNYEITLVAMDSLGCSDSYTLVFPVDGCEDAMVYIPNSFTPNGDGVNDLFRFTTSFVEDFELTIFNRLGAIVFSSVNGDHFWNGDDNTGYFVSDGVYVYTFRYTGFDGVKNDMKGTITIFR